MTDPLKEVRIKICPGTFSLYSNYPADHVERLMTNTVPTSLPSGWPGGWAHWRHLSTPVHDDLEQR